jgi:hypothetical protein
MERCVESYRNRKIRLRRDAELPKIKCKCIRSMLALAISFFDYRDRDASSQYSCLYNLQVVSSFIHVKKSSVNYSKLDEAREVTGAHAHLSA